MSIGQVGNFPGVCQSYTTSVVNSSVCITTPNSMFQAMISIGLRCLLVAVLIRPTHHKAAIT